MILGRMLVPIDCSAATANLLQYAGTLARDYRAAVTLLHVIQPARQRHP